MVGVAIVCVVCNNVALSRVDSQCCTGALVDIMFGIEGAMCW